MHHKFVCHLQFSLSGLLLLVINIQITATSAAEIDIAQAIPLPPPQDVIPPPSPTPPPQPTEPLPPPEELLQPPSIAPTPPITLPERLPDTVVIKSFNVVGSTVFSAAEFKQLLAPFTNRPISFAELLQARSAVTQLYIDRGYITSGALIPPQTLQAGVVTIQVIEGELEAINITGTRRLNPNYVRSRIAVRTDAPLNQQRLLEALQLLQLDPRIQTLSAELSVGSRPGTNVLDVQVQEARTLNLQVFGDNRRSPSVGSFRRGGQINEANLLGFGDSLSVGYNNTDGSNTFDVSYALPINPRNGTIGLDVGAADSSIIEPPFDFLEIDSYSRYYDLTFRQPVSQSPAAEFVLGLTASRRESNLASPVLEEFGVPLSELSPGADDAGRTRISALRFFQEWTQRGNREVIAARSQFSLGIGAFDATINDDAPDSRFFSWRGQAQWVRLLAPDTLLLVRGDVQLADQSLVPVEQFSLGGFDSVRGYRQDALLTDNGAFASVELRVPISRIPDWQGLLQLTPFVDFGTSWNTGDTNPDPNTLVSVGLGLRLQVGNNLTARIDWGIPLVDITTERRTWQENGVYFSVVASPF
ncbi:ShlB/FhaC/HecB family hemolysin secretion/activation protein [Gloeocapsopsis dulcis]|uniref:Hemolysin activation/secretion protein n=1 Tax=Gloeocapsopsis dulcis AAB1 = 1H9 TaxID=1433147 RepID=A0A6N8FR63_9CHRO|nr:ShlB/FhaC/HecB family hemolysin secretion/activation protein [Gloeocapsopsis dulcis]MUL35640.1 hemolysin activation/secretion protein [Gloeocapsopsis dulcis AAB1 = 1H9]WNN87460.1 ShlB/FhaC/HecB family hemolysin secretion/activation protein [Gloeocapsopsis dulcis]